MPIESTARTRFFAGALVAAALSLSAAPVWADDKTDACDAAASARFDADRPTAATPVDLAKIDSAKAIAACEAAVAAAPTDRRQIYQLGRAYLAAKTYPKALDAFKKASDMGSAMAMSDLASMNEAGLGTPKDANAARSLSEKAADAGNAQAQFNLAVMLIGGKGGAKDYTKARALLEKAATAKLPKALFRLGYMQELGLGGPVELEKARINYVACSNDPTPGIGQPVCQRRLGFLLETGKLGRTDPTAAKILFEKAAASGDIDSMRALGQVYEKGAGVPKDYAKARDYYEKAAAKGDSGAMRLIAGLYEKGLGVPRDANAARQWLDKAKSAAETEKALKDAGAE
jgi:TPR repeat protein